MNQPADQIAREIQQNGPMTLARFMELALFSPGCGYYERQQEIGQHGDFYTSVSVGSVFGELLAFQFAAWLEKLPRFSIIEAGAHQGQLAADILGWIRDFRGDVFDRLEYVLIEASPTRRAWQCQTLRPYLSQIRWIDRVEDLPFHGVKGVIFSNEFLDATPAHRLGWDAMQRKWREWRIVVDSGKFSWSLGEMSSEAAADVPKIPPELGAVLPDRFTVEISPQARAWWKRAVERIDCGKLLMLDYGFTGEEWLQPKNAHGTLRGYAGHRVAEDPLANPGDQDLTAHVHFSALQDVGEAAGFRTDGLAQSIFLTRIFEATQKAPGGFAEWTSERVRQFQTLTHPEHLGRSFRALVQSRLIGTSGP